jgi:hypothetical protein
MTTANASSEERRLAYLAKAEEARGLARTVADEQARRSFERIAQGWQNLAEQLARNHLDGELPSRKGR